MRKAAGILMIIFSVATIGFYFEFAGYFVSPSNYLAVTLFVILSVVPIITGGGFCLKRKYWKLCFAFSLWLLFFVILFYSPRLSSVIQGQTPVWLPYGWPPCFLTPMGILPQIFICLRKREWQEQELQG
jgi:hypothetical protein